VREMEQVLLNLIDSLSFGDPWRISDKAVSVVVPILRVGAGERKYVLLEEVKEKVKITDTGSIGRANVENRSDKNVFIRKGVLLAGPTQSRGVVSGTVIPPQKTLEVEIQCVYASKGIRTGATFTYEGIAPREVEGSFLHRRSQGATWRSVNQYTLSALSSASGHASARGLAASVLGDDLIGVMRNTERFREDIDKILEKVPGDLVDQVGLAVLDLSGVVGVEFFDHPDSWSAFSKSIIRNYGDTLAKEQEVGLFEIKMENVVEAVKGFLGKLSKAKKVLVNKSEVSESYALALEDDEVVGEYTAISGETIHLIGSRKYEQEVKPRQARRVPTRITGSPAHLRGWSSQYSLSSVSETADWVDPYFEREPFFNRKGSTSLLDNLADKPETWKRLEEGTKVSTRTLSSRLKEATNLGLVEQNGKKVYSLTPKGWKAWKKTKAE